MGWWRCSLLSSDKVVPSRMVLPLLVFPCTIKSRSSLLAPAHLGGPRKRAVKWLWWCGGGGSSNLLRSRCMTSSSYQFLPLFPVFSCYFECHILSFHQVTQQVHSFPTSCSLTLILPSIISCSNDSCLSTCLLCVFDKYMDDIG